MTQKVVYYCKGYFEGELHNLAMFDNEDAAHDFCLSQEGQTYVDLYYEKIPIFSSLTEFYEG